MIEWDGYGYLSKNRIINEEEREVEVKVDIKEAEPMENGKEESSMWDYDPKCLPKEFVGLDEATFLEDPSKRNLCFLDKKSLILICSMVRPPPILSINLFCSCPSLTSSTCPRRAATSAGGRASVSVTCPTPFS